MAHKTHRRIARRGEMFHPGNIVIVKYEITHYGHNSLESSLPPKTFASIVARRYPSLVGKELVAPNGQRYRIEVR